MPFSRSALATCCALLAAAVVSAATQPGPPRGEELREASLAIGYDVKERCPDLVRADPQEPAVALVVLLVGPSGVPSQASLRTSSGSSDLDAAALRCVMKVRYLPAVRAGEGTAAASWQEIAWKWSRAHLTQTASAAGSPAAVAAAVPAIASMAPAAAAAPSPGSTEVRVCADATGKLRDDPHVTRSSGDARLDTAAVAVARAGAPYYPPAGGGLSGCAQLIIRFEPQ